MTAYWRTGAAALAALQLLAAGGEATTTMEHGEAEAADSADRGGIRITCPKPGSVYRRIPGLPPGVQFDRPAVQHATQNSLRRGNLAQPRQRVSL